VFIILVIYWILDEFVNKIDGDTISAHSFNGLIQALIIGVTILVVAVPEGLPLAVTISLAFSMGQMMKDHNLVRELSACEIMGGATNICSDKTGTLTENKMTVVRGEIAGIQFEKTDEKFYKKLKKDKKLKSILENICEGLCLNTDVVMEEKEDGTFSYLGSKTEGALIYFAMQLGYDYKQIRSEHSLHRIFAFSSLRKRMSVIIPYPEPDKKQKKKN